MQKPLKDAITICKTILRNGYDAHIINAPLHERLLPNAKHPAVDLASEADTETLFKLFPKAERITEGRAIAGMEQDGVLYRGLMDAPNGYPNDLKDLPTLASVVTEEE